MHIERWSIGVDRMRRCCETLGMSDRDSLITRSCDLEHVEDALNAYRTPRSLKATVRL
jgi:hypothetical protein